MMKYFFSQLVEQAGVPQLKQQVDVLGVAEAPVHLEDVGV